MEAFLALIALFFIVVIVSEPFRWLSGKKQIKKLEERVTDLAKHVKDLQEQIGKLRAKVSIALKVKTAAETVEASGDEKTVNVVPASSRPASTEPIAKEPAIETPSIWKSEEEVPHIPGDILSAVTAAQPLRAPAVKRTAPVRSFVPTVKRQPTDPQIKPVKARPRWRVAASEMTVRIRKELATSLMGEGEKADLETLIGGRWLNVIGIVVLVVGISLFLGYTLRYYGPLGKVATGIGTGIGLVAIGVFVERSKKYRLFARPIIGGGWALLYFTAYATHNVEAARIIENPVIGLVFLILVAAGIIGHSFKYRSQVVTGLAYGLGFLAVAISPLSYFSLIAISILAATLIAILRVMPWYHLGLAGVAATYVTHLFWQGTAGDVASVSMGSLWLSQGILAFYWFIFVISAFVRRPQGRKEEDISIALNVSNTVGFFALSGWQLLVIAPNDIYLLTGAGAMAYASTAYLLRVNKQRLLHLFNASMAVVLAAVTFPLAVDPTPLTNEMLAVLWVAEAAGVIILGFRLHEIVFRVGAYLLCFAGLIGLIAFNIIGAGPDQALMLGLTVLPVAAFFFWLFEKLPEAAYKDDVHPIARLLGVVFGYAATALIAALVWDLVSGSLVGAAWLALSIGFFEFGGRTSRFHVRGQSYALAGAALLAFLQINLVGLPVEAEPEILARWVIVTPAVFGFYYLYVRLGGTGLLARLNEREKAFSVVPSYAGTLLLTALLWKEAGPELVGLAWLASALLLFEWGTRTSSTPLRTQGYVLATLALGPLFIVNLYGFYVPPEATLPERLSVVVPAVVAVYALSWRLHGTVLANVLNDTEQWFVEAPSYAAATLLAVLLWKELNPVEVSLAWAALGLAFFEIGSRTGNQAFRLQGHALAILASGRLFMANFTAFEEVIGLSHRLLTVLPVAAIFYYLRYQTGVEVSAQRFARINGRLRPFYSYGAVVLLVVLARFELGRAYAIMGWAPLTVVLLILGTQLRDRDFRYQSYLLAILTFARGWATSLTLEGTLFGIPERFATSVPAVVALLAAAFYCLWRSRTAQEPEKMEATGGRLHRFMISLETHSVVLFSFLGASLVTILLFYEVGGNLLTIAWTVEAFVLLAIGFVVMDRSFRYYGLGLLLVCLIKLVVIDLAEMDAFYRILSFIVLGVILLLISLGYTRYRDILSRYI